MILNLCGLIRQTEGLFGSDLPYFQLDLPVGRYQLKIGAVGGDQPGTVRARGERDKHVEMQVSQLVRREPFIATKIRQQPPGLQPIILCWSQDAVVLFECSQEIPLNRLRCATPQLRQNDGGQPDEATQRVDPLLMTSGAQVVDKDRCVEDGEVTHRGQRMIAFPRASASSP
jgi:hypothetical protein